MSVMPDITPPTREDDMRAFMVVVRQALLTICAWIERRYGLNRRHE